MNVDLQLLAILVCPVCKNGIDYREKEFDLICSHCQLAYPIKNGIPILLKKEASPLTPIKTHEN
jgi:uncharacterized protein YbaR (Trm112 family)